MISKDRKVVSIKDVEQELFIKVPADNYRTDQHQYLYGNLALPSYVHGYSLAIEYMYNWFKNKFPKDFFRGGIYIDGSNVLNDYKRLNDYTMRNIVKGQNPRARMAPRVQYDYDRDLLDVYHAPPQVYLRRSRFQDSFFKDYDRDIFLGFVPRALRMDVEYKVRLNSRSQQLDTYNMMELYFRNGATQSEYLSLDFHVPKAIILDIAKRAGFEIVNGEVKETILFLHYLNAHSDVTFLFKLRAINLKTEYFIRLNDVYTHIAVRDKLQLDDGERDGKLDFNFHIEMNSTLTIPIPHFYAYYAAEPLTTNFKLEEPSDGCVAVYSINTLDIPYEDKHGWQQGVVTDYLIEKGDTEIDLGLIIGEDNPLSRSIYHHFTKGVSPSRYINVELFTAQDSPIPRFTLDWENRKIIFEKPQPEFGITIVIYYDKAYIAELEIQEKHIYNDKNRIYDDPDNHLNLSSVKEE